MATIKQLFKIKDQIQKDDLLEAQMKKLIPSKLPQHKQEHEREN